MRTSSRDAIRERIRPSDVAAATSAERRSHEIRQHVELGDGKVNGAPSAPGREGWSYSGDVWTNAEGRAVVTLPAFVRLHRGGFEYELTPLGAKCEATLVEAIAAGRFTIATSRPHVKVAWRVTPLREQQAAAAPAGTASDPPIAPTQPAEGSDALDRPTDRGGT